MPDTDQQKGAYQKFDVRRADGSSEPGGKHENCKYWVLDLMHDKFSIQAMTAYAIACRSEYPALADDLERKVKEMRVHFAPAY